jgi:hypothetical protein
MTTQAPLRSRRTKAESVYHVQVTGDRDAPTSPLVKIQGCWRRLQCVVRHETSGVLQDGMPPGLTCLPPLESDIESAPDSLPYHTPSCSKGSKGLLRNIEDIAEEIWT